MKKLIAVFLLITAVSCSQKSEMDLSTADKLAEGVFNSLKSNSVTDMQKLAITNEELKDIRLHFGEDEAEIDRDIQQLKSIFPEGGNYISNENVPEDHGSIRRSLFNLQVGDACNWENAEYSKIYKRLRIERGLQTADLLVEVKCFEQFFYFSIEAVETLEGNWKILDDCNTVFDKDAMQYYPD